MKLLVLLVFVAGAFAGKTCHPNSNYDSCGTFCPLTCDNYQNPPRACIKKCNPGCHCNKGYVMREDGWCVLPENCPQEQECGVNEHYNECGTACPPTCDNIFEPPKACPAVCVAGCECNEGFVKNPQGTCVLPAECPFTPQIECGENERFTNCGSACPPTCDSIHEPPKACPAVCVKGCECVKGYVRDPNGMCVLPSQCPFPELCGENERYMECGSACPPTCDSILEPPTMCPAVCVKECQCVKGFVRNSDGRCVEPKECFSTSCSDSCSDNQEYTCKSYCKDCCQWLCI